MGCWTDFGGVVAVALELEDTLTLEAGHGELGERLVEVAIAGFAPLEPFPSRFEDFARSPTCGKIFCGSRDMSLEWVWIDYGVFEGKFWTQLRIEGDLRMRLDGTWDPQGRSRVEGR